MPKQPSDADALDLVVPGAPDTRREASAWLSTLARERRLSPKTIEAYRRDLRQFLVFLDRHLGEAPSLPALAGLKPLDIRAFLASRRGEGVESRSLLRQLAALRSFARHLEREGHAPVTALDRDPQPEGGKIPAAAALRRERRSPITDAGPAGRRGARALDSRPRRRRARPALRHRACASRRRWGCPAATRRSGPSTP